MECKSIQERLSAYLEGTLPSEEKRLIQEHLNSCKRCFRALEELKKTGEMVRNLKEVEPPAWMTQKIMARVKAEQEKERRIFQKLFYPLHIKVPIEALATVLIAVVAVYVFRAVEPEMKSMPLPPAVGPVTAREEAPKPSREPGSHTPAPPAKEAVKEEKEKDKASAGGPRQEEKSSLSRPAEEPRASQPALQGPESPPLSDVAREPRERKKLAAAPKAMGTAAREPAPLGVSVTVKDVKAASSQVETFLGQAGARNIERESYEGREVLTAELKAQSVGEFLEKLKAIGETKGKVVSPDIAEGNVPIRVEIVGNP